MGNLSVVTIVVVVVLASLEKCSSWTVQGLRCQPTHTVLPFAATMATTHAKPLSMATRLSALPVPDDPDVLAKAVSSSVSAAKGALGQVTILMWTRTAMNYQYKFGGTFGESISALVKEGGVGRLYSGIGFALLQVPTRYG